MKPKPEYISRITRVTVLPPSEPIFSERATEISIIDEAAGEFIEIRQCGDNPDQSVKIGDEREWKEIKDTVDMLFKNIRIHEKYRNEPEDTTP
jgi:hypothetical protein